MANIRIKPVMGSRYNRASHGASRVTLQNNFKKNMADILDNVSEFVEGVKDFVPEVLVEALEPTLGKAIDYCPKDTNELVNSAYLEVEKDRGKAVVAMGFGRGGQPDYAIYVHEMPYKHEAPTRNKFLESALDEDYYTILNSIPRLIRQRAKT